MEKLSNKCPCNTPDCPHGGQCDYGCEKYVEWMTKIRASLEAYEDTELSPEEIERILDAYGRGMTLRTESGQRLEFIRDIPTGRLRELAQADREGRCVVLPYKPPKVGDVVYEPVYEHGIVRNTITFSDGLTFEAHGKGGYVQFCITEIGKSVFLTAAEAKAALQKGVAHDGD